MRLPQIKIKLTLPTSFSILLFLITFSLIPTSVYATGLANFPWPKHGNDSRNSSYVSQNLSPYLTIKWVYTLGTSAGYPSSIVGSDNTTYISTRSQLIAINPDGTEKWTYSYGGTSSEANFATPLLDDNGVLWIEGWDGSVVKLFAVNSSNGSLKGTFNTNSNLSVIKTRSIAISPDGSTIYYPQFSLGILFAINSSNFQQAWSVGFGGGGSSEHENIAPAVGSDGTIYLGHANGITAFNPSDGSIKWTYASKTRIKSGPTLSPDDSKLYFVTGFPTGQLVAVNASDGTETWSSLLQSLSGYYYAQPAVDSDGIIYVGLGGWEAGINSFRAFNPNGMVKWSNLNNVWTRNGLVVGNGIVYGLSSTGGGTQRLYSFDKSNGTLRSQYKPSSLGGTDEGMQPAVDSDNNVYYPGRSKLVKLAPWTLSASSDVTYYHPGDTVTITATSSMLKTDPTGSEDNQVQVIMPNDDKVTLSYVSSANGETTWSGTYTIPQETTDGAYTATVEAGSVNVQTDTTTHFATAPTGSNNTGITNTFTYTVDNTVPTGSMTINSNDTYTITPDVTLTLAATDTTSGVSHMMVSEDSAFSGASWETYAASKSWTLSSTDGTKTVYVKFKDTAGNISEVYSDTIIYDSNPPSDEVSINGNATYTKTQAVTLTISATDVLSGIYQMMISEQTDLSDGIWEAYATTKSWTFSTTDGTKTIYIKFKDLAGNISSIFHDSIILDTTVPLTLLKLNNADFNSDIVTWEVTSTKPPLSGTTDPGAIVTITVSGTPSITATVTADATGAWSWTPATDLSLGAHTVIVTSTDPAGNTTSFSFTLVVKGVTTLPNTGAPLTLILLTILFFILSGRGTKLILKLQTFLSSYKSK